MAQPPVSEEDLHAFVDGETDAQVSALIQAFLADSPKDAARVEAWRHQNELVRAIFSKVEHEPIPLSLSLTPPRNLRADTILRLVPSAADVQTGSPAQTRPKTAIELSKLFAAVAFAFASGMVVALITSHMSGTLIEWFPTQQPGQTSPLPTSSTADLSLPLQTLEIAKLRENSSLHEITNRTDASLSPSPDLTKALAGAGLSVTGVQMGMAASDPEFCLFLSTKSEEALTLCQAKAPVNSAATQPNESFGFRAAEAAPLNLVEWIEPAKHFALTGRLKGAALLDSARRIHTQISNGP